MPRRSRCGGWRRVEACWLASAVRACLRPVVLPVRYSSVDNPRTIVSVRQFVLPAAFFRLRPVVGAARLDRPSQGRAPWAVATGGPRPVSPHCFSSPNRMHCRKGAAPCVWFVCPVPFVVALPYKPPCFFIPAGAICKKILYICLQNEVFL